jgi:mono/diheme cytochrome c family protein
MHRGCILSLAVIALIAGLLVPVAPTGAPAPAADAPKSDFAKDGLGFVQKHCVHCHGEKTQKADLALHAYKDEASVLQGRKVWQNVLKMVQGGEMPPKGRPKPSAAEAEAFVRSINSLFERVDSGKRDPGRVTIRRLNRAEYNNTIRDLVGIDFSAADDFPSDDVGHGFDNIGDVLSLSPVLMERYLAAAESITQRAILVGDPPKPPKRHTSGQFLSSKESKVIRDTSLRSLDVQGDLNTLHKVNNDGEYKLRFRGWERHVGDEHVKVAFLIDGKEIQTTEVKGPAKEKAAIYEAKPVHLKAGEHKVAVVFLNPFTDPKAAKPDEAKRTLFVQFFELEGPLDMVPATHKRIMACKPDQPKREQAREILTRFASRAYRRPATRDEVERLLKLVDASEARGDKWEASIQLALQAILVSPKFLFRVELDDRPNSADPHPIDEYQLASRLSYFLWSSMPDEELFNLAAKKQLTAHLDAQVQRMLKDPKARALTDNFAMQWLQLRRLQAFSPDPRLFPAFNDQLRAAMLKETELFFHAIVSEDRSILDLIDADFTFLNEPLARHYGIVDTNGNHAGQKPVKPGGQPIRSREFLRVALSGGERGGILTQASVLTVTSNPTRTSPVKRGRWVLEQLLGTPPPPPPPNVPELPEGEKALASGSLRQRMEQHRANPSCANCHARMDPLGFAFENFNAIGAFRTKDGEFPIDASGVLPDGRSFNGSGELKAILKAKKELFGRCLTEKLSTYALGRGVEYYDKPAMDKIVAALEKHNYKFSVLVAEIAKSDPFRLRRGKDQGK